MADTASLIIRHQFLSWDEDYSGGISPGYNAVDGTLYSGEIKDARWVTQRWHLTRCLTSDSVRAACIHVRPPRQITQKTRHSTVSLTVTALI